MLMEQLCHFPPTKACWFQNSKSDRRKKLNPQVPSNSLYRKGTFSVIMTFSIRENFLCTCQSSTYCWSLISSTKMEHISLLSASPKAEKLSFSLYSSSNQNSKSWGSSPCSSPAQQGRQLELRQMLSLTKQSRDLIYTPSFLALIPTEVREKRWSSLETWWGQEIHHPYLLFSSLWATSWFFYKHTSRPPLMCASPKNIQISVTFQSWQSCSATIDNLNSWSQLRNTDPVLHLQQKEPKYTEYPQKPHVHGKEKVIRLLKDVSFLT